MTIDEAIGILNKLETTLAPTMAASGTDAIKLGIEALKRYQTAKGRIKNILGIPLPGETKD